MRSIRGKSEKFQPNVCRNWTFCILSSSIPQSSNVKLAQTITLIQEYTRQMKFREQQQNDPSGVENDKTEKEEKNMEGREKEKDTL